jgi:gamma-butyrobetaine dioxygenase
MTSTVSRAPDPTLDDLVASVGLAPERCAGSRAAALVERDGAAILTGGHGDPRELVVAAAELLGTRLRTVFPVRQKTEHSAEPLDLHSDGANVVVDVHGRAVRLRDPDEDYLFQLCRAPAASGGDSILVDGHRLLERLRVGRPELHTFLTTADVDFFGGNAKPTRGVPHTPLVRRLVEYTRGGRLVVRASTSAAPAPQEPQMAEHARLLQSYADVLTAAAAAAPRFRLETGELLVVDNYRMLHGRDGFRGRREMCILTVLSSDAW